MSLRLRLAASLAAAFAAILVLGGALLGLDAERRLQAELAAARTVATNRVAGLIAALPAAHDVQGELAGFARSFNGDRHVQMLLVDPNGQVRAASTPDPARQAAPAWFGALFGARPRTIVTPLSAAALPVAAAAIVIDPAAELGEIWSGLRVNLLVLALFLALATLLLLAVIGRALRPLDAVRAGVAAIGRGEAAARVPVRGPQEMAALARGFNDMADRLDEMGAANRRLADQVARLAEEERAELARDLHDEIGPALFAIDVDAGGIERLARAGDGADRAALAARAGAIRRSAAGAKLAVRRILGQLRPGLLPGLGLAGTLRETIDGYARRHPEIDFRLEAEDGEWGEAVERLVAKAVREAVNNAVRHGRPTRVTARISRDEGGLRFCVVDDGGGLPETGIAGGFGLIGMRERVEAAGGTLSVSQVPLPAGLRVEGVLPLSRRPDAVEPEERAA
ncbi:HAMP domain-containing sensor histidine kinase [Antarcticirhabdus aurantiaca]|uniref:Histidine kinase n=1 Tax=Antarcticirhabdus aurantiaca TaxID=2606717 RepID=A0ACD4NRK3_9HYPH|nr:histidine kinase [Antarcticirhabdus aurantiaca]WAJ29291.1 histidine kinase [Jeongeuplla avenae]